MTQTINLLDPIALTEDLPQHALRRGQVGTVVEVMPDAFEVEFADTDGQAYAMLALRPDQLMRLHHEPARAAG
jgi:ribosomal protein L21E